MMPRDLFRGPRGAMGGPGSPRGLRETSRGSHWAIGLVWWVFWWFMRHICLYTLDPDFHCVRAGGRAGGSTRGSTRGPRGPKNAMKHGIIIQNEGWCYIWPFLDTMVPKRFSGYRGPGFLKNHGFWWTTVTLGFLNVPGEGRRGGGCRFRKFS